MLHINYSDEIKTTMKKFFETLSEKDRRRYAAIEAMKLGHGGQKYICEILGCEPDIVKFGVEEFVDDIVNKDTRIRKPGGGRKKLTETIATIGRT